MAVSRKLVKLFCHRLEKKVDVEKIHMYKTDYTTAARNPLIDEDIFTCQETAQCNGSDCNQIKDAGIDYLQKN